MASQLDPSIPTATRRPRRRRAHALVACSLVAAAVISGSPGLAGTAGATDRFSGPQDLSAPGGDASVPQVASDPAGDAIALWLRNNGTNDIVEAAHYTPAVGATPGYWSAVAPLSAGGQSAVEPAIEIDDAGNAVAAWRRSDGTNFRIEFSKYSAATGTWSPVGVISDPGGDARGPELSVDPAGNFTAAWYRFDSAVFATVIESRRLPVGQTTWQPKAVLSNNNSVNSVISRVAADANGHVFAIWRQDENTDPVLETNVVYASRFDAATNPMWSAPFQLSESGQNTSGIQVGVDAAGNATAVWSRSNGTNQIIQSRRYVVSTGIWSPAVDLSAVGGNAFGPRVGADNSGTVTVIWRRENAASKSIVQAVRYAPSTGTWSGVTDLSADGQNALAPRLAVDPSGMATAVWVRKNGTNFIVQSARLSLISGSWGAATDLSQPGQDGLTPQTDVDGDGNVIVVWARSNGTNTIVQASISSTVPGFTPVTPVRVFDTRPGESPEALRQDVPKAKVGGANVLRVRFANLPGYTPATGVSAVSLNVAVANPVGSGFVTVFPCGTRKEVASINFVAGQTVSNAVIAPVSAEGDVCFYGFADTDIIVDLNGWFPTGSSFTAVTPARVFDTRPGQSADAIRRVPTVKVAPGVPLQVQVTGLTTGGSEVTPATGVSAVSLNLAVTNPDADGFVTVYPCGTRPFAASANYIKDQTVSNAVIAPVSASGAICFYSLKPTDIVVDINGWFGNFGGFVPAGPQRLFDTRGESSSVLVTVPTARITPGVDLRVKVTDTRVGDTETITPPTGVGAVSLNVTVVNPAGAGFITVYPCGTRKLVASVNYLAGQIVPNAVIAPVSADGYVCFYSYAPADIVVDINGYFPTNP